MKKTILAATAALVAAPGFAAAQNISLQLDPATGDLTFSSDVPLAGLQLDSAAGNLLPENAPIVNIFGSDFINFGDNVAMGLLDNSATSLAGGNTGDPADIPAVSPFTFTGLVNVATLGDADSDGDGEVDDLSFSVGLADNTPLDVAVTLIPEPASLGLAGLAGLALVRRRRA